MVVGLVVWGRTGVQVSSWKYSCSRSHFHVFVCTGLYLDTPMSSTKPRRSSLVACAKLIIKPKPSFDIPPSLPDPLFKPPCSHASRVRQFPYALSPSSYTRRPHSYPHFRHRTPSCSSQGSTVSPRRPGGRYLQLPSPTPTSVYASARVRADGGKGNQNKDGEGDVCKNKDPALSPITEGAEWTDALPSSSTLFFDAAESLHSHGTHSCGAALADGSTMEAGVVDSAGLTHANHLTLESVPTSGPELPSELAFTPCTYLSSRKAVGLPCSSDEEVRDHIDLPSLRLERPSTSPESPLLLFPMGSSTHSPPASSAALRLNTEIKCNFESREAVCTSHDLANCTPSAYACRCCNEGGEPIVSAVHAAHGSNRGCPFMPRCKCMCGCGCDAARWSSDKRIPGGELVGPAHACAVGSPYGARYPCGYPSWPGYSLPGDRIRDPGNRHEQIAKRPIVDPPKMEYYDRSRISGRLTRLCRRVSASTMDAGVGLLRASRSLFGSVPRKGKISTRAGS